MGKRLGMMEIASSTKHERSFAKGAKSIVYTQELSAV